MFKLLDVTCASTKEQRGSFSAVWWDKNDGKEAIENRQMKLFSSQSKCHEIRKSLKIIVHAKKKWYSLLLWIY